MKNKLSISLALLLWIGLFYACQPKAPAEQFLHGSWVCEMEDQSFVYEIWNQDAPHLYTGQSFAFRKDKLLYQENMKVEFKDDTWWFAAQVSNQNEGSTIQFEAKQGLENHFIFENSKHDYPQRIEYKLNKNGNLQVSIALMDGSREAVYYFKPLY